VSAPERSEVAVRAWAVPDYLRYRGGSGGGFEDLGPSLWTLVFDTETTTDVIQRLRLGTWQLRRRGRLRRAGIFYDPDVLTDDEVATVNRWASARGMAVMTAAEWVDGVLLHTAWDRRGLIVGHNLPFDIARVAIDQRPAQSRDRSMRGAFSFQFSPDEKRSHIQVKRATRAPRSSASRFQRGSTRRNATARTAVSRRTTMATSSTQPRSPRRCSDRG
jgi:hypothetical protein